MSVSVSDDGDVTYLDDGLDMGPAPALQWPPLARTTGGLLRAVRGRRADGAISLLLPRTWRLIGPAGAAPQIEGQLCAVAWMLASTSWALGLPIAYRTAYATEAFAATKGVAGWWPDRPAGMVGSLSLYLDQDLAAPEGCMPWLLKPKERAPAITEFGWDEPPATEAAG